MDEQRLARTVAAGAAGAIALGAAFGIAAGELGGGGQPVAQQPTGNSLDAFFPDDRGERASRGLSSRAPELRGDTVARAQAPVPLAAQPPPAPSGPAAEPLPPVPENCEEYSGNRQIGCTLLQEFGFGLDQMPALDDLWTHESGWNHQASNPSSGAYGIPQALPGSKMASVADDWETNPATQIRWGLGYIKDRYGSPDAALAFWQSNGWY